MNYDMYRALQRNPLASESSVMSPTPVIVLRSYLEDNHSAFTLPTSTHDLTGPSKTVR